MDTQDKILLLVGECHGKLDNIQCALVDHQKRIRSLETSRTKYMALFGAVSAGFWAAVEWVRK